MRGYFSRLVLGALTAVSVALAGQVPSSEPANDGPAESRPVPMAPTAMPSFEPGRAAMFSAGPLASHAVTPPSPRERNPQPTPVQAPPSPLAPGALGPALAGTLALSLSAADLDEDGVPDLAVGRAGDGRSLVVLYRGNLDAIFPRAAPAPSAPFFPAGRLVELRARPDFLASGDFDNDGHADLVAAAQGGAALDFLPGDGRGGLRPAELVALPGVVTAMVAGEINRIDGLADLVVGVDGAQGPAVLVFEGPEGAVRSTPEIVELPAPAEELLLAARRAEGQGDLRIIAGGEPWLVEGRDRQLSSIEARRGTVTPPRLRAGDFAVEALPSADAGPSLSMRLNQDALPDQVVIGPEAEPVVVPTAIEATITVNSAADNATAGNGACTLREAILNANANADTTSGDCVAGVGADLIGFNIAGGGAVATIAVTSELPAVTGPATLDGTTQGCPTPPCIELDGVAAAMASGLRLTGGSTVVRGFAISRFDDLDQKGISVESDGNIIEGNFIGTNAAGTLDLGNHYGVRVVDASNNTIGGTTSAAMNLVSGNASAGVQIRTEPSAVTGTGSTGNVILGNAMGTNRAMTAAIPNLVAMEFSASSGNTCGGTTAAARNLLSGNTVGLSAFASSTNNLIQGNFIGTNAAGTAALANEDFGGFINESGGNTFGGTAAGAGNVISGNGGYGLVIQDFGGPGGTLIQGNRIGTDAAGGAALGNLLWGMYFFDSPDSLIGGTVAAARNVISANERGFVVDGPGSTANVIAGNFIGTDITGTIDLGNLITGLYLDEGDDNVIGGTEAGAGNLISGNDGFGVVCAEADGTQILGNRVGTRADGMSMLGNTVTGIGLANSSNCTIGGTAPGSRNVISGNEQSGIFVYADDGLPADGNVIQGNYIGTDAAGLAQIGNFSRGIALEDTTNTLVGGTTPEARNVVSGNLASGVLIYNPLATANRIVGNYIGPNAAGAALGNLSRGVWIATDANGNRIGGSAPGEGNVISSNFFDGIRLSDANSGNLVEGNLIGLDPTGTFAMGNGAAGVTVEDTANSTIGGTSPGSRNVISGNSTHGVRIIGFAAPGNRVWGNFIGTEVTGTVAVPNAMDGVHVEDVQNDDIGGSAPGQGNLISGNLGTGVAIVSATLATTQHEVLGNLIGTDVSGTEALPNGSGVLIQGGDANTIGGTSAAAGNVISGNFGAGIRIASAADGNNIRGNWIGVDITGMKPLPNGAEGVEIDSSLLNSVGGTAAGAGNLIANNTREGVEVTAGTRNAVLGNSIVGNGLLGIELGDSDGPTANDALDADTGVNNLQNYPVLASAAATPSPSVTIAGSLGSKASTAYRIEFFSSPACDGSGHGEGGRFLGFVNATTNAAGTVSFSPVLAQPVSNGDAITATANDPQNNTSEFSLCVTASCSTLVVFGSTVLAADKDNLVWSGAQAVRFVRGPLAAVSTYTTTSDGELLGASGLDISGDDPGPGSGFYYLVRPLGCGSWQSSPGVEPGRDAALP